MRAYVARDLASLGADVRAIVGTSSHTLEQARANLRDSFDLTVNDFVREVALGNKLVVYGEQFWRPFVHIQDMGDAIARVLDAQTQQVSGEVFNVGAIGYGDAAARTPLCGRS